jgi:hypothetical protein
LARARAEHVIPILKIPFLVMHDLHGHQNASACTHPHQPLQVARFKHFKPRRSLNRAEKSVLLPEGTSRNRLNGSIISAPLDKRDLLFWAKPGRI